MSAYDKAEDALYKGIENSNIYANLTMAQKRKLFRLAIQGRQLEMLKFFVDVLGINPGMLDMKLAIDMNDIDILEYFFQISYFEDVINVEDLNELINYTTSIDRPEILNLLISKSQNVGFTEYDFVRDKNKGTLGRYFDGEIFNYSQDNSSTNFKDYELATFATKQDYIDLLNTRSNHAEIFELYEKFPIDISEISLSEVNFLKFNPATLNGLLKLGISFTDNDWKAYLSRGANYNASNHIKTIMLFLERGADPFVSIYRPRVNRHFPFWLFALIKDQSAMKLMEKLLYFPEIRHWPLVSKYMTSGFKRRMRKQALDQALALLQTSGFDYNVVCQIIEESVFYGIGQYRHTCDEIKNMAVKISELKQRKGGYKLIENPVYITTGDDDFQDFDDDNEFEEFPDDIPHYEDFDQ